MDLYLVCGHCNKLVSEKTFKEHKRLFFHEQGWVRESNAEDGRSRNSSPLCLSDPSEMPSCSSNHDLDITNSSNCNFEDIGSAEEFDVFEENVRPDEGNPVYVPIILFQLASSLFR